MYIIITNKSTQAHFIDDRLIFLLGCALMYVLKEVKKKTYINEGMQLFDRNS